MYNKRLIRDRILQHCPLIEGGPPIKIKHINIIQVPVKTIQPLNVVVPDAEDDEDDEDDEEESIHGGFDHMKPMEPKKKTKQAISDVKAVNWSTLPEEKYCPRCHTSGKTKIQFRIGMCTWAWAIGLFFSGVCLPCFWFPLALPCTKDALHICRNCNLILGRVARDPCTKGTEWKWGDKVKTPLKNPAGDQLVH